MRLKKIYIAQLIQGVTNPTFITKTTDRIMKMSVSQVRAEMIILYGKILKAPFKPNTIFFK